MKISLRNRHTNLRPGPPPDLRRLIARWARLIPLRLKELSVVFIDDAEMGDLHGRVMNDPSPTDILTFDYGDKVAEIFISLDTAKRQAAQQGATLRDEVKLYLAHGLLHLAGFNDHKPAEIRRMRQAERALLSGKPIERPSKV